MRNAIHATKLPRYRTKPCDSTVGAGSLEARGGKWAGSEDAERSAGSSVACGVLKKPEEREGDAPGDDGRERDKMGWRRVLGARSEQRNLGELERPR